MKKILIAGAGPTGLTAALELYRLGYTCRVVDRKPEPSQLSRAVGINPRSLEILEPSGVSARLIESGFKMESMNFRDYSGKIMASIKTRYIPHRYNYLIALPQDRTEDIMRIRLSEYDGKVEYGTEVTNIKFTGEQAGVTMKNNASTTTELYDLVIAADGAHSIIRQLLDIPFEGYDYKNLWSVADFTVTEPAFPNDQANIFLYDNGEIGLAVPIGERRYRGASNTEKIFDHLPPKYKVEKILNEGTFKISVRQAKTYQKNCVYLAGDAAHTHSPAGGRGMNLGIEDAYTLAKLIAGDKLESYTNLRHPAGEKVLAISERLSRMVSLNNIFLKLLRNLALKLLTKFPALQKPMMKQLAGLD